MDRKIVQVKRITQLTLVLISLLIVGNYVQHNPIISGLSVHLQPTSVILESPYNTPDIYEQAFVKYSSNKKMYVVAAITSHHFLAKDFIAQTYAGIDSGNIKTVFVVSPDHYEQILQPESFCATTNAVWKTPFGNLYPAVNIIDRLISNDNAIIVDTNLFRTEHGIYIEIPFIKKVFPNAQIVPLVVRQTDAITLFYSMGEALSEYVNPKESIVIISSDFSHDVSSESAQIADRHSIDILSNHSNAHIPEIANDCRQCIALLFGYLSKLLTEFHLINNLNSFDISGQNSNSVTSYVGGYYLIK